MAAAFFTFFYEIEGIAGAGSTYIGYIVGNNGYLGVLLIR